MCMDVQNLQLHPADITNNIVYMLPAAVCNLGIDLHKTTAVVRCQNNTVFGFTNGGAFGLGIATTGPAGGASFVIANNMCFNNSSNDYSFPTFTGTLTTNMSSDATGTFVFPFGPDLRNAVAANEFVNPVPGPGANFLLKAGATAIGAATSLGTTNEENLDIVGYNRNLDPAWDLGADQFNVAAAGFFEFDQLTGGMPDLRGGMV